MRQEISVPVSAPVDRMHDFMLAWARVTPDAPAVVEASPDGGASVLSFRQLEQRVHDYAATLDGLGLDLGDRVILESDTSGSSIAMFLACSSLGLTFVPVSPETPLKRLLTVMETVGPALYVQAVDGRREGVPGDVGTGQFGPEGLLVERRPEPRVRHRREPVGTDTAYMIFTSGTTGRPKGVVMSHRGVVSFYRGMLQHAIVTRHDRVATTSPLQFDFSLLDIGLALGSGAAVVPVPRDTLRWPRRFVRFLQEMEVTQVDGVPSIWRSALRHEAAQLAELHRMRGILFCGEDFPLPELRRLQELLPQARIVNCYGATESMACSFTDVPNPLPEDLEKLSIGFAHPGAEMMIVDESGRVVEEPGVMGEIHLRTPALFTGYWDDPEATRAAQVPDPLDPRSGQLVLRTGDLAYRGRGGEMYFCGRIDSQVQIRGNRVETGEVERKILEYPGITAAAVLVIQRADRDPVLGAFVSMAPDVPAPKGTELSAFCAETLPAYMAPRELHVLDDWPVTAHGKTDRAALAAVAGV
ncbi:AMP-binding protein [Streptomyces sp. NPDC008313]|uniref:AMP-binding protein n=1 Tax=Streptomyces sp. NPDC008313 TaxID=3364826 RepID=UPI0036EFA915